MMKKGMISLLATTLIVGAAQAMELNEDQEFDLALKNSMVTFNEEQSARHSLSNKDDQFAEYQNQIIGTQAIGGKILKKKGNDEFKQEGVGVVEEAKKILEMGSKILKTKIE